jgi:hypothetical protein
MRLIRTNEKHLTQFLDTKSDTITYEVSNRDLVMEMPDNTDIFQLGSDFRLFAIMQNNIPVRLDELMNDLNQM